MKTILHASAVIVATALLASCEGGGHAPVRHYVGTVNYGQCKRLDVVLDLAAGHADIARRQDHSVDCSLTEDLVALGCSASFVEIDGGRQLSVTIEDCAVPTDPIDLLSCLFRNVDENALESATDGHCTCATQPACIDNGPTCRTGPVICIGSGDRPGACENCENGADDNHDGSVDCDDPECSFSNSCGLFGPNNTTITCPSSSSTTVTTVTIDLAADSAGNPEMTGLEQSLPKVSLRNLRAASPRPERPAPH